jgi:MinD superfamily P-loop ATPase
MTVAIASGKGGTGKTTVATGLAISLAEPKVEQGTEGDPVQLLDCDVEEPNSHFFLHMDKEREEKVTVAVPRIDQDTCTACGTCVNVCRFNALALIGEELLVFDQLCHSCGGCALVCPVHAITEQPREIGEIESFRRNGIHLVHGRLNIGEPMSPPLIRVVKKEKDRNKTVLIDSPPGTTCPMVVSVQGSDFCILVTENTPFGFHDLEISVEVLKSLTIPMGVVINRADIGSSDVEIFCRKQQIPVLLRIPFSEEIARAYSSGKPFVETLPEYKQIFRNMFEEIEHIVEATW